MKATKVLAQGVHNHVRGGGDISTLHPLCAEVKSVKGIKLGINGIKGTNSMKVGCKGYKGGV